jgi:signal peptidase I
MNDDKKTKSKFKDTVDSIVVAFVIAMIIRAFFVQAYKIPSGSMLDTLLIGDHILVNKLAYAASGPKYKDIIVFEYPLDPSKDFIKRVIGVPGDTIRLDGKDVYRNGNLVKENYAKYTNSNGLSSFIDSRFYTERFVIPENKYFVMGDNRDSSFDGRYWGFVDKKMIKGKAFIIYWSWDNRDGINIRFDRILNLIH